MLVLASSLAHATEVGERPFGLGLQLGEPFGITGKYYLGGRANAIDFLVGANYDEDEFGDDDIYAHVNYHWHLVELTSGGGVTIPFRLGVGGFLAFGDSRFSSRDDEVSFGARMPVGLDFDLESVPLQFYVEVGIQLVVYPPVDFGADAGIGARYYF